MVFIYYNTKIMANDPEHELKIGAQVYRTYKWFCADKLSFENNVFSILTSRAELEYFMKMYRDNDEIYLVVRNFDDMYRTMGRKIYWYDFVRANPNIHPFERAKDY